LVCKRETALKFYREEIKTWKSTHLLSYKWVLWCWFASNWNSNDYWIREGL